MFIVVADGAEEALVEKRRAASERRVEANRGRSCEACSDEGLPSDSKGVAVEAVYVPEVMTCSIVSRDDEFTVA